jgi:hypothetical protein
MGDDIPLQTFQQETNMSKRRRHAQKQLDISQIEWLKHRTGYPTPEERDKIIRLRQELSLELIQLAVMGVEPDDSRIHALVKKYGAEEVERATQVFGESMSRQSLVADDAFSYRDYRLRYARFGDGQKFYTAQEVDELFISHMDQLKDMLLKYTGYKTPTPENDLNKLLLISWNEWKDITPPAPPPRPADFQAPQPASYPAPIHELLDWGDDLNRSYQFADETDYTLWRKLIPTLTRMALDPGLLNGWPAESASWAPWHAIHMLGNLQAWESAPTLAKLADLENDWLSDHLPHIWAEMGMEVEPSLWMILENPSASVKQRGLAAQGLSMMAEEDDAMEIKVIKGFEKILGNDKTFDPTVNAYLIHFLREMEAEEDVWDVIESAFNEERVDLDIITPEDLEEDDYDEEEFDDDFDDEFDEEEDEKD